MSSIPTSVPWAASNDLNPNIGRVTRFTAAMILFHNIIEIFDLADGDRGAVLRIVALDGRFIGRTPVDRDLLRHAVAADRLGQEALGRLLVPLLRQAGNRSSGRFIHGAIEIIPLRL